MFNRTLPHNVEILINELDEAFPEKCIDQFKDIQEAWMYAGKRSLIRYLKAKLKEGRL